MENSSPWHLAIYQNQTNTFEQICGGTIISAVAVLSAAHCFWDPATEKQNVASLYRGWQERDCGTIMRSSRAHRSFR